MASQWCYSRDGQEYGPLTGAQLIELARQGELRPDDLVSSEAHPDWVPASRIRQLADAMGGVGGVATEVEASAEVTQADDGAAPAEPDTKRAGVLDYAHQHIEPPSKEPSKLYPMFPPSDVYYGWEMREQFSFEHAAKPGQRCVACEHREPSVVAQFRWNAVATRRSFGALNGALLTIGVISWRVMSQAFGFETHHPLCGKCWHRARPRPFIFGIINFFTLILGLIGLFVFGIGWGGYLFMDMKPSERPGWLLIALIGTAALASGIVGQVFFGKARIPPKILAIARAPFFFHSAMLVDKAPGPDEDPVNDMNRRFAKSRQLTWQMALCVILIFVALVFAGLWVAVGVSNSNRAIGRNGVLASAALFAIFLVWHIRARRSSEGD